MIQRVNGSKMIENTALHLSVESSNMDSLTADAEFGNHTTPLEGSVTAPQAGSRAEMRFPGGRKVLVISPNPRM